MKIIKWILIGLASLVIGVFILIYLTTYHPADVESETIFGNENAPLLQAGQQIKIMSWNVQYMAGKNYVFYYDLPGFAGPDERPSTEDIALTFGRVAQIIKEENPDLILLQEVDVGAKRTDFEDQVERLLTLLPDEYRFYASAWYWKAAFVPHPRIKGKVGMKLATISKFKIEKANRIQLPQMLADPLTRQFNLKRCVLDSRLPIEGGQSLALLNTHLDAFAHGSDTMEKQVAVVYSLLDSLESTATLWLLGGDFNLLPPGQYSLLTDYEKQSFNSKSELAILTNRFFVIPAVADAVGPERPKWFTQFPNDPKIDAPNKTIDYIFYSTLMQIDSAWVRQKNTLNISDHLPVIAEFQIPD